MDAVNYVSEAHRGLMRTYFMAVSMFPDRILKLKSSVEDLAKEYSSISDFSDRRIVITKDIILSEADGNESRANRLRLIRAEYDGKEFAIL